MKVRRSFNRLGIGIVPFLFLCQNGFGQTRLMHHMPPSNGIIGEDLTLSAATLEVTNPIDATLYYRLPDGESYLEIPFHKTGFNWEVTIPGFGLTEAGLEYVIAFKFSRDRVVSFPMDDPFNHPHHLTIIPPVRQKKLGVFGELPAADVLILSPGENDIVDQYSILVAASFFNANKVDASSVRLLVDGVDVSSKMMFEEGLLSYDPGPLMIGVHVVEIKMNDLNQQEIAPIIWTFTVGSERKKISEYFKYDGRIGSRLSVEEIGGVSLNIAEIMGDYSIDLQWAKLSTDLRLSTRETQYLQPHNRFGTQFSFGNFLNVNVGDFYPRFSPFTVDGKRIRGLGIDANLKWIRLQFVNGELNRNVNQKNRINGGYRILTDLTQSNEDGSKTYFLDRTGFAFKRKVTGLRASLDLFSKFKIGIHFMKMRDDTSSVTGVLESTEFTSDSLVQGITVGTYNIESFRTALTTAGNSLNAPTSHWGGVKPMDNIVFGFNLGTTFDDKKLTLDFDWNMSMFNRDIWDGTMSKADLDTALDDSLDGFIGLQYDKDGNEISGSTKIKTSDLLVDPIKFKDIFIINTNMTPLVPFDVNTIKKHPISTIINMPSSAFSIRLRGHYARNSLLMEYRQVGPEYVSLANPFLRNNARQFTISDRVSLMDHKLFLNIGFKHLDNKILRTTVNPLNTNTLFINFTFLPGPGMPSFIVNYQSIGKNNEKTQLDSIGSRTIDLREDSKAATNMMAITIPFTSGNVNQNLTLNIGNVTNVDQLIKKRSGSYLFPKTDSKTISINLSSSYPSQLKTIAQFSQTKLEIPSMDGSTLIKIPYTWTNIAFSANYKMLDDKMLARGSISLLNSQSQVKSQLFGLKAGADYRIRNNLSASIVSQIRLNYVPSFKKDEVDNDGDGKVDNAGEVLDINSMGIILNLQYNF
ncbi:MAG: hypothetical protein HOA15_03530 [Candidatus Marinimicrobia bacterium]|mgnify:FL=1|uniref:Uncharacterized protein n=1 Tax=uncultured bacterium FPPZ_5C6 TaxID=1343849 RepID=S4WA30_9BACT|nr:hypothetical protein [uncultured bacterium FPPZ_5C6]MBT3478738.1 hypothetical protein [Candidatus Neomarinimicrobiota bacterium]MBT3763238.1 hypothetical protein [Candidatus Neomarinimicrobiota bacterium]MBT5175044.1 hypothetical protein [Candidatus Neomarinimicrobiota bacterium]MBT6418529.1 hypothetical protein [Candidatus Neomarinimicrobiota bacterium]